MAVACETVRAAISAYRFGGETPASQVEAVTHLKQCADCRATLAEVVGAADERLVAQAFASVKVGDGFAAGVLQRLTESDSTASDANNGVDPRARSSHGDEDSEIEALLAAGRHGGGAPGGRSGMGMVIQHCALCRERIDTADLKSGSAIKFKGQAYCSSCKSEVEDDPDYLEELEAAQSSARRKSGRREAVGSGIHAGMGRRVRSEPGGAHGGGGGANPAVLYGGIAAAVVLVAVIGYAAFGPPSDSSHEVAKVPGRTDSPVKRDKGTASKGGTTDTPAEPVQPARLSMADQAKIDRAIAELREQFGELKDFAEKNQQPEMWSNVNTRFDELLASRAWTRSTHIEKSEAVIALRTDVEQGKAKARDRFDTAASDTCRKAVNQATGYAARSRITDALKILADVPPIFRDTEAYKPIVELRAKILKDLEAASGQIGEWVTVDHDKWSLPTNQAAQKSLDAESGATYITGTPSGALVVFTPEISQLWRDYVVEMEAWCTKGEGDRVVQLGMRIRAGRNGPEGRGFGFAEQYCGKWVKLRLEVKGQKMTGTLDGESVLDTDMGNFQIGKPVLLVNSGCTVKIKSARFMLNSIHTPR